MNFKKNLTFLSILLVLLLVLAACGGANTNDGNSGNAPEENAPEENAPEENAPEEDAPEEDAPAGPVTLTGYDTSDVTTLDPQLGEDVTSINMIENLFVHLTNYDLDTAEVVPEAATSWTISEDGLIYTFTIRTDIPWVNYNPITEVTTQETDDEGNPRFVTAHDFVYGIQRACSPDTGSYYSSVVAPQILGCEEVLYAEDASALTQEDYDAISVTAVDDGTLVIELAFPAGYFLSMTPIWTLAATPAWALEANGDRWIEAGNIVTSGRYVLAEWIHGVNRVMVRNPLMPADMAGSGNIDRVVTNVVPDGSTGYALWLAGEVETSGIPDAELQNHLETYPDETAQIADLAVFYFGFATDVPPFDDKNVRAAFSMAFDRVTFIDTVRQGQGLPMKHFAPPGIFGAPPINEVGVGYDPVLAAAKLAEAGYPGCEGFPSFTLLGYSGQGTLNWIEYAQANWAENLGCDPAIIQVEQLSFSELLAATKPGAENRPDMHTLGWGPDYADENNWVGDVLYCENAPRLARECSEVDDLIIEARLEQDPDRRVELYAQIEEMFFGEDGLFPMAPLFLRIAFQAKHSWYDSIPALFGGSQIYNYSIDAAGQAAGQ